MVSLSNGLFRIIKAFYLISKLTMALEQELMEADKKADKKEEVEQKNFDNLSDEEIEAVKEMAASA